MGKESRVRPAPKSHHYAVGDEVQLLSKKMGCPKGSTFTIIGVDSYSCSHDDVLLRHPESDTEFWVDAEYVRPSKGAGVGAIDFLTGNRIIKEWNKDEITKVAGKRPEYVDPDEESIFN
jgi:hypothetical protein